MPIHQINRKVLAVFALLTGILWMFGLGLYMSSQPLYQAESYGEAYQERVLRFPPSEEADWISHRIEKYKTEFLSPELSLIAPNNWGWKSITRSFGRGI